MNTRHLRRIAIAAVATTTLVVTAACGGADSATPGGGGGSEASASEGGDGGGGGALSILFGSSGQAETDALNAAVEAWSAESGTEVTVTPAQDLTQQLAQGFSSGQSPDLFYVGADQFANYASAGNLYAYAGDLANADDFYPALVTSFTYEDQFYCAPKDMSTLALFINTDLWSAAGLTDADVPTTWDELTAVSEKLTSDAVAGMAIATESARLDAFMVQNGSYLVAEDGTTITANDAKNAEALDFVKSQLGSGSWKSPAEIGAGWAGEAFGKKQAAMTIEGNWLLGAISNDFPDVKYTVAQLPAGPTGDQGTLVFTNCWGIAETSPNKEAAVSLVQYLTQAPQQLEFANAFGVIPSIQSASADYVAEFPDNAPFVDGVEYARGVVSLPGITDVIADYNAQLETLKDGSPQQILDSLQENLEAAVG